MAEFFRIYPQMMADKLAKFDLTKNRTQWLSGSKGERILSDVYNSNPTAAKEVLTAFKNTTTKGDGLLF